MINTTIDVSSQTVRVTLEMSQFAQILTALRDFEPKEPADPERWALRDEVRLMAESMAEASVLSIPLAELVRLGQAEQFVREVGGLLDRMMATRDEP